MLDSSLSVRTQPKPVVSRWWHNSIGSILHMMCGDYRGDDMPASGARKEVGSTSTAARRYHGSSSASAQKAREIGFLCRPVTQNSWIWALWYRVPPADLEKGKQSRWCREPIGAALPLALGDCDGQAGHDWRWRHHAGHSDGRRSEAFQPETSAA